MSGFTGQYGEHITAEMIKFYEQQGKAFSVTGGIITTGAGSNDLIGLQFIVNNIAKDIIVYSFEGMIQNISGDLELRQAANNTQDGLLTANLLASIQNHAPASTNTSLMSAIWGSPALPTQTSGQIGLLRRQIAGIANAVQQLLEPGSTIFIPKGGVATAAVYLKIPTTGNSGAINLAWLELP